MRFSTATLFVLMIAGCSNDTPDTGAASQRPGDSSQTRPSTTMSPLTDRPANTIDTSKAGGGTAGSRMKLVGEGLPFSTYYPEDEMEARVSSSGEGTGLRFIQKIAGVPNKEVSIHFFFPPTPQNVKAMNEYVTGITGAAANADWALSGSAQMSCPWAEISYLYKDNKVPGVSGSICIGQHNGEAFYMITHYPAEHAAVLESNAGRILSQIRWKDGTPLRKE